MSAPTLYGQLNSERVAEENQLCRQIVKELGDFGISQRQMLMIIYLLAMQLDNVEHMQTLTREVREMGGDDMFLTGQLEPDIEVGGTDGKINV